MKDKFPEWLKKIQKVHPKADEEVLRFIYDFQQNRDAEKQKKYYISSSQADTAIISHAC